MRRETFDLEHMGRWPTPTWADHLVATARGAEMEAGVAATLDSKGRPFSGGRIADARVRAAVVATLRVLAAGDSPDRSLWDLRDLTALADEIEGA